MAIRAMYGRCAAGTENEKELPAIEEDGITIDMLSSLAIASSRPTKITTITIKVIVASAVYPCYDETMISYVRDISQEH